MAKPNEIRINSIMYLSVIIVAILVLRLVLLQVFLWENHLAMAQRNMSRLVPIPAPRGMILDRNGEIIARNRYRYELALRTDPNRKWEETYNNLVEYFTSKGFWDEDQVEKIYNILAKNRRYQDPVIIEKDLNLKVMFDLEENRWLYPHMEIIQRPVRHYEERFFFPQLMLGMLEGGVPRDNSLEARWNEYLKGKDGYELWTVNVNNVPIGNEPIYIEPATPGNNLVLTIDAGLQRYVQKVLTEAIEENQRRQLAKGQNPTRHGAALVVDVRTGDILAVANYPEVDIYDLFNPQLRDYFQELDSNYNKKFPVSAHQSTRFFEFIPFRAAFGIGSTAKILSSIIALEEGVITPNYRYHDTGKYSPKDSPETTVSNVGGARGMVNLKEAFQVSLNTYFVWMMDQLPGNIRERERLIRTYTDAFGLTRETGLTDVNDFFANQMGRLFDERDRGGGGPGNLDPSRFPLGAQAHINVSPLHMANLVSIVANKGYHYKPRLVKQIEDQHGNIIEKFEPEIYRTVPKELVSDKTYQKIHEIMNSVTKYGPRTGTSAWAFRNFPIEVAAKTGTSHVQSKGDHSWWVGFAPLDKPEIAVVVFIEHGDMHGMVGPTARKIMEKYFGLIEE
ncbi:Penicillin-binding Protein dimerisation domain-containing protein [Anaerobranca californiensis DSM 14826]|jgi:penicillin-binding protein 2|uniref:beta-lactamase n=1 Tax=Anaerobranca californiensis DSM 14826 TaxID=1120989 RepID=A0A1M6NJ14_9FIRM|nr:penicillin-binding transpeptidase domain-containing protein [Anaerobranca californiensis]SHJ95653.1 Penicillin-binding Protein dimerisation domain-containing protein [Anaerobranca californiensis DSM 14826]